MNPFAPPQEHSELGSRIADESAPPRMPQQLSLLLHAAVIGTLVWAFTFTIPLDFMAIASVYGAAIGVFALRRPSTRPRTIFFNSMVFGTLFGLLSGATFGIKEAIQAMVVDEQGNLFISSLIFTQPIARMISGVLFGLVIGGILGTVASIVRWSNLRTA